MEKKFLALVCCLIFTAFSGVAEGAAPFEGLKELRIEFCGHKDLAISVFYSPKTTELYQGKHPQYEYYYNNGVCIERVMRSRISEGGDEVFLVDCDSGGSGDPSCTVYREDKDGLKKVLNAPGIKFYFPGNGHIYVSGHTNSMFDHKVKYVLDRKSGQFDEAKQPFYYVGVEGVLKKDMNLYSTTDLKEVVAVAPKGSSVGVLLNNKDDRLYLIRTAFGLVGWVEIPPVGQEGEIIDGIFFAGD